MTTPPQPPPGPSGPTPSDPSPWAPAAQSPQGPPPLSAEPPQPWAPLPENQQVPPPVEIQQVEVPPVAPPPISGPPPGTPPLGAAPAPEKSRDYRSVILVAVIIVALAIAALLGGELYARSKSSSDVNAAASCLVQDGASVSFGPMPLLVQYLGDHIDTMTIKTAGNQIKQAKKMAVTITLHDISLKKTSDSLGTVGRIDAAVTWPSEGITESAQELLPAPFGSMIGNITTSAATGLVTLNIAGGLAKVSAKPVIENGTVTLEAENLTAVIGLPRETVQPALDLFTKGLVGQYPMGLTADDIHVTDDGVQVNLSSTNQPLKPSTEPCLQHLSY